jgi:nitroreductase
MDALECIRSRASVRKFQKRGITEETLKEILGLATAAPSARNSQDWEFIVVREEGRARLVDACRGSLPVTGAPVSVAVCSNLKRIARLGERGLTMLTFQDTAAACQNLMLAAWAKGIGSCWVGSFEEEEVSKALGLPEHIKPVAVIALGYPEGVIEKPKRLPLDLVIHWERFEERI